MIPFDQIIAFLSSERIVIWPVFLASALAIGINYYDLNFFVGLPSWAFPTIKLILLVSGIAVLVDIYHAAKKIFSSMLKYIARPIRMKVVHRRLLDLSFGEVFPITLALVQCSRFIKAKPDAPVVLSLEKKGIIKSAPLSVISYDGLEQFEIPKDVWERLNSMREFYVQRPQDFSARLDYIRSYAAENDDVGDAMCELMPQEHPAVMARMNRLSS